MDERADQRSADRRVVTVREDGAVPAASAAMTHAALSCAAPEHLGAALAPSIEKALHEGLPVTAFADPTARDGLTRALGGAAERLDFVMRPDGGTTRVVIPRHDARSSGRSAVHETMTDLMSCPEPDLSEDRINVMLADRPVTLICGLAGREPDDPSRRRFLDSHPRLLEGTVARANATFAHPRSTILLPAIFWGGTHAGRFTFREDRELREVRDVVTRSIAPVALDPDHGDAAVLAVHEAALASVTAARDGAEPCTLDAWTVENAVVFDVSAPPGARPEWRRQLRLLEGLTAPPSGVRLDAGARLFRVIVTGSRADR